MKAIIRYRLYPPVQRLLHKINLHYAPPHEYNIQESTLPGSIHKNVTTHHWCQWCGLRGEVTQIRLKDMK